MNDELSRMIRCRRDELGLTQAALAKSLGVSQQTVARWERGGSAPSSSVAERLGALLGLAKDSAPRARSTAREEIIVLPPVRSLVAGLPLDQLTPSDFERLTHALVSAVYPETKEVHRVGGPGHVQSGADVIAESTLEGRVIFQCKRVSRSGRFGPSMVEGVVKAAASLDADKRVLVLSRVASPQARQSARKNGWDIWDHDDIVHLLQTAVAPESARRIVRTFFPGHARDFLGLASVGPWLSIDEMYAGQLEGAGLFTHTWSLLGRESELEQILDWVQDPDEMHGLCRLLVGAAGIGKSRLLIELSRRVGADGDVWFADSNVEVKPEDFDSLDAGPVLLVIDDAHDRQDVGIIVRGALLRNIRTRTRVLLATRPYGKDLLVRTVSPLLRGEIPGSTMLGRLDRSDARLLAAQVLEGSPDSMWAREVDRVAGDSTMLTVATALMLKQKRLKPALTASADELRRIVLEAWAEQHESALIGLPGGIEARRLMQSLAAVQPLELANREHVSALAGLLGTDRPDDAIRAMERAVSAGVATKRAGRLRVVPDMLADYVLADACYSVSLARATGFADWAWQSIRPSLRRNLLVNLSRVDWQLEASGTSTESLVNTAWAILEVEFRNGGIQERAALLSLVADTAYYQPRRSLELARWALANPVGGTETGFFRQAVVYAEVLHAIPKVLRHCAFHIDHLDESLDLLWELAQCDQRPTNQYPDHPLRVLCELASYSLLKPFEYSKRVIGRALGWLDREPHPAVFEVLGEAVKWDAEDHIADGLTINMRSYSALRVASAEDVLALRRRVIDACINSMTAADPAVAMAAAQTVVSAVRSPGGLFGRSAEEDEIYTWGQETATTLQMLSADQVLSGVAPLAKAELLAVTGSLAELDSGGVQEAAVRLRDVMGDDLDVDIAEALRHGPWRRELRKPGGGSEESERRWLKDVASRLLDREKSIEAAVAVVEAVLAQVVASEGASGAQAGPLTAALVEQDEHVATVIAERVGQDPRSVLAGLVGTALSTARREHADDVLRMAVELLATGDVGLRRQVAYIYGWGIGYAPSVSNEEMCLIHQLAMDDDLLVARNVAGGLRFIAAIDPMAAIEVLLELRISRSPDLADDTLVLFSRGEALSLDLLNEGPLQQVLDELLVCPSIDQYWVKQFLGLLRQRNLARVVQLLRHRVERAEQHDYSYDEYRPLPFGWEDKTPLSTVGHPNRMRVLRDLVDWATEDVPGWRRDFDSPRLFASVAGTFDNDVLSLLVDAFSQSPLPVAKRAARLLSELPKSIIWDRVPWISRVLESALVRDVSLYKALVSALWAAVVSGGKSGTPGEPYPQDIEQRDRARAIADSLPRGSATERFYRNLQQSAESEIARKTEEDEELF